MRKMIAILAIVAMAIVGMAGAEDFVNQVGGTPLIKDLGNLSMEEIRAIFSGDGAWMNIGGSPYTASQTAFMKDNPADGKGLGEDSGKHGYVGSAWKAKLAEQQPAEPVFDDGVMA